MKGTQIVGLLFFLGAFAISSGANANRVELRIYNPETGILFCGDNDAVVACAGFIGSVGANSADLDEDFSDEQIAPSGGADDELDLLNDLIASLTPPGEAVEGYFKDDSAKSSTTITREYFALKQAGDIFFFKNLGGSLEIKMMVDKDGDGENLEEQLWSHSTQFGKVVPIPAAAWLFGTGLIGLAGIARKRKAA